MKLFKLKLFRLSWVLVVAISAFLLGRFLQPQAAGFPRGMRRAPSLDFSKMQRAPSPSPMRQPLRRNVNPYQR